MPLFGLVDKEGLCILGVMGSIINVILVIYGLKNLGIKDWTANN